jgi:hypothetical protein
MFDYVAQYFWRKPYGIHVVLIQSTGLVYTVDFVFDSTFQSCLDLSFRLW